MSVVDVRDTSLTIQTDEDSNVKHQSLLSRVISFLREDIDPHRADIQLIALGFATGVADVMCYKSFSVFAANQTGNTVLLALIITGTSSSRFSSAFASLLGFLLAGFISGQLSHLIGNHRRWWLVFNNFFQTALIFIAAILLYKRVILTTDNNAYILVLLLGISYGCQVAIARFLSCPEIPTAVLTTAFIDLLSDQKLLKPDNLSRNRRFFISYFSLLAPLLEAFHIQESTAS